jgi:hypothetical protein
MEYRTLLAFSYIIALCFAKQVTEEMWCFYCPVGKPYVEDTDKMWRFTRKRSYGDAYVDEQV